MESQVSERSDSACLFLKMKKSDLTIALIAHDGKKPEMVAFVLKNKELLAEAKLCATGTTGTHIENIGFQVQRFLSGSKGGDAQIAAKLTEGYIDLYIFFRDPLEKHSHESEI